MSKFHLRSYLPRRLFARTFLIVALPMVVLQLVVGQVFIQRHYQSVTAQMARGIALEIGLAGAVLQTQGPEALVDLSAQLEIGFAMVNPEGRPAANRHGSLDVSGRALIATLPGEIVWPTVIDLTSQEGRALIWVQTDAGQLLADVPRRRVTATNPHQLLVLMISLSLMLLGVAALFLRNQVRPIRKLAMVSSAFGKGQSLPISPAGSEEVRHAISAFLAMRTRLERQMGQRTQMLSAISHDLRTPLTRLKLSLEMLDAPEAALMRNDLAEMQALLDEFLDFAAGAAMEDPASTDLSALAQDLVRDAGRAGGQVELVLPDANVGPALATIHRSAVERAVQNLLANALRHGTSVRLSLRIGARSAEFVVEDNGPGIAAADRARALRPFARLDAARSRSRGEGVGLGLAIALDVARSHGGTLELGESRDLGGLRAALRLPL